MRYHMVSAAIAAIGMSATAPSARAADTVLLGGVGNTAQRIATDAPTMTLKGLPHDDASFEKTHWGYYRPWVRPWGVGYYRPWVRPWYGFGWYRPWGYRPWLGYGLYRPWVSPWYGWSYPWYGISYAYAPAVAVDYGYVETIPASLTLTQQTPAAPSAWPPEGPESLPTPAPPGSFRYDGGPVRPVPPTGAIPAPAADEPSAGRAAPTRLVSQPRPKRAYPAYGEPPAKSGGRANDVRVSETRP